MYAQLEDAGLIVGTEEWEARQEEKYIQIVGKQGEKIDVGRERNHRKTLSVSQ